VASVFDQAGEGFELTGVASQILDESRPKIGGSTKSIIASLRNLAGMAEEELADA
jgi:hypothetical protein